MAVKTLTMPEDAIVSMLKSIPKKELLDIFLRTVAESDVSPLSAEERVDLRKSRKELKEGKTVRWADLR